MDCRLLTALPIDVMRTMLQYLTLRDLGCFDCSLLDRDCRTHYLQAINGLECHNIAQRSITNPLEIPWLTSRQLSIVSLHISSIDLHHISLSGVTRFEEDCCQLISQNQSSLAKITLQQIEFNQHFFHIFRSCSKLRFINVEGCPITDETMQCLLEGGKEICSLNLSSCQLLTSASIDLIALMCPKIQYLILRSLSCVTDPQIAAIIRGCPNILSLDISETMITDRSIPLLLKAYPNIHSLLVQDCRLLSTAVSFSLVSKIIRQQLLSNDPAMHLEGAHATRQFLTQGM
jgi:hypothetical protein